MITLPNLPYQYTDLEPFISKETLQLHHDKHHAAYVNKLNELLTDYPKLRDLRLEELLQNLDKVPQNIRQAVLNNAGQVYNHNLYFESLRGGKQTYEMTEELYKQFDQWGNREDRANYHEFERLWTEAGLTQFGSGWVWLVVGSDKSISIEKTANADSPLIHGRTPILTMDVWEHAYYVDYKNARGEYIKNFFQVINWAKVSRKYSLVVGDR
jgi:superoxide dismutase, Fe-Mn family